MKTKHDFDGWKSSVAHTHSKEGILSWNSSASSILLNVKHAASLTWTFPNSSMPRLSVYNFIFHTPVRTGKIGQLYNTLHSPVKNFSFPCSFFNLCLPYPILNPFIISFAMCNKCPSMLIICTNALARCVVSMDQNHGNWYTTSCSTEKRYSPLGLGNITPRMPEGKFFYHSPQLSSKTLSLEGSVYCQNILHRVIWYSDTQIACHSIKCPSENDKAAATTEGKTWARVFRSPASSFLKTVQCT